MCPRHAPRSVRQFKLRVDLSNCLANFKRCTARDLGQKPLRRPFWSASTRARNCSARKAKRKLRTSCPCSLRCSPRQKTGGIHAIDKRQRALAVVAIRTDAYEQLQTAPTLSGILPRVFSLPPIERAEFKAVIEGPAARATAAGRKLTVQPALTERLLEDTEGADALPLLAFTLELLFTDYGVAGNLRLDDYEALGGACAVPLRRQSNRHLPSPGGSPPFQQIRLSASVCCARASSHGSRASIR